jgi:hypothetical protein
LIARHCWRLWLPRFSGNARLASNHIHMAR